MKNELIIATEMDKLIEDQIKIFREKFINDHNKGEERFLRGLFVEDFEQFLKDSLLQISHSAREQVAEEIKEQLLLAVDRWHGLHPSVLKSEILKILSPKQDGEEGR